MSIFFMRTKNEIDSIYRKKACSVLLIDVCLWYAYIWK